MGALSEAAKWWDLVPAALGAILGAAAGAVPTFIIAKRSFRETLQRDADARTERQRSAAFRLMVKLLKAVNDANTIKRQIDESVASVEKLGLNDSMLWEKMTPLTGLSPTIDNFDAEELAVVFSAKENVLANDLMLFMERHHTDELILIDYAQRRRDLCDSVQAEMNGMIGSITLTPDQYRVIAPRAAELESIAVQAKQSVDENAAMAIDVVKRYVKSMQKYFDDPEFLKLDFLEIPYRS